MKLGDLLKMTKEERAALYPPKLCPKCKQPFIDPYDKHKTIDGIICGDCYYEELGDFIENNPIGGHKR